MRAWRTPDGRTIVEGAAESGGAAPGAHEYFVLGRDNELDRVFRASSDSVQEWLYHYSHTLQGDKILCYVTASGDSDDERTEVITEFSGLVAAPEVPAETVDRAVARFEENGRRAAETAAKVHARRLDSFRRALPEYPDRTDLVFAFTYEGEAIAIRGADREIIWRDATYACSGKYLYPGLDAILKERYGARLKSFDLDLPGPVYLLYNPD